MYYGFEDWGVNLTMTGLIATVLSVIFAIAAFHIQRKSKRHGASKTVVAEQPPSVAPAPAAPPAQRPSFNQGLFYQEPAPSTPPPGMASDLGPVSAGPQANLGAPAFKRYSPMEKRSLPDDGEYIWE